ncbi:hypothetical protein OS493_013668, partial [Desmophyllum pertusum]
QGFCEAAQAGLQRDPNKNLRFAQFNEHLYHVLDVPEIETVIVQTGRHCLLRCVKNDQCFSTNIAAFHRPDGNISCEILPTDKYHQSEKFKANQSHLPSLQHYGEYIISLYIASCHSACFASSQVMVQLQLSWNFCVTGNCGKVLLIDSNPQ